MNHTRTITAAAALAVAGTTALTASAAAPAAAGGDRDIFLQEKERQVAFLDLGKKGFSVGDRQTISGDLFNRAGDKVGRNDYDCAITADGPRVGAVCTFVLTLRHGQLTGTFFRALRGSNDGQLRQAITGGTGRYAGAAGDIELLTETKFVVHLR